MHKGIRALMFDEEISSIEQDRMDMYESLMTAIIDAGGSSELFHNKIGKNMTVIELIDSLAQNGVRFCRCVKKPLDYI